jgi:hypothetical protein
MNALTVKTQKADAVLIINVGYYGLLQRKTPNHNISVQGVNLNTFKILPEDVISLIKDWLQQRSYYVNKNGVNSLLLVLLLGTVQGSILRPVFNAIFVLPLFDLKYFLAFADDIFIPKISKNLVHLVEDMEKAIEANTKPFRQSCLKVNNAKTILCLFHKHDITSILIRTGNIVISSSKNNNMLRVLFHSELNCCYHIASATTKANRVLKTFQH